ncbi:MAG: hypothetical protein JWL88_217 [Parcubacteria group bacterium]|nr:hypothetical protein [Parcubacteria group bacterium]
MTNPDSSIPPAPTPLRRVGPLFEPERFKDVKDPCIAFDGTTWHIYGSGGDSVREEWEILHATAPNIIGPWTEQEPAKLRGVEGPHVAAPTVYYDFDDKLFHMAVQKDFMDVGGDIAYLVSADGCTFTKMRTLVTPKGAEEAGLYDPHFAVVKGKKYMVYSGVPAALSQPDRPFVPQPDVYLARSTTDRWAGFWKRMKAILRHEDIAWHHNRRENPDYEWGIEGPQLVELPNGQVLLNATCFVEEGPRGERQRVFFAVAKDVKGPYVSLGPVLPTTMEQMPLWENGENGHASAMVHNDELYLFYQARSKANPIPNENNWRYGIAVFDLKDFNLP